MKIALITKPAMPDKDDALFSASASAAASAFVSGSDSDSDSDFGSTSTSALGWFSSSSKVFSNRFADSMVVVSDSISHNSSNAHSMSSWN